MNEERHLSSPSEGVLEFCSWLARGFSFVKSCSFSVLCSDKHFCMTNGNTILTVFFFLISLEF